MPTRHCCPPPHTHSPLLLLVLLLLLPSPTQTTHGDLWITFKVDFPKSLSDQQKEQLRSLLGEVEWQRHDEL